MKWRNDMPPVVLDTNILVSALIVRLAGDKLLQTRYSDVILREYIAVLSRKRFNFRPEDIAAVIKGIMNAGISVSPVPGTIPVVDESARKFYDAAKSTGSILITENGRHYPAEFIRMYEEGR